MKITRSAGPWLHVQMQESFPEVASLPRRSTGAGVTRRGEAP